MSSAVGIAGVGLIVQACSWKGVRIPGGLAAVPLGAEARAHGHSRFTGLIGSHCGARLSKRKKYTAGLASIQSCLYIAFLSF